MERDERGRPLTKRGRCPVCKRSQTVLADEDIECCEPEVLKDLCDDCGGSGSDETGQDQCDTCHGSGRDNY